MRACRGLGLGWSPKGGDCHDIPVNLSELVRFPRHKSQSLRLLTSRSSLRKRHVLLQGFLIHECLRMRSSINYFFALFLQRLFVGLIFNKTACSLHPTLCCKLGCLRPEVPLKLISEPVEYFRYHGLPQTLWKSELVKRTLSPFQNLACWSIEFFFFQLLSAKTTR